MHERMIEGVEDVSPTPVRAEVKTLGHEQHINCCCDALLLFVERSACELQRPVHRNFEKVV